MLLNLLTNTIDKNGHIKFTVPQMDLDSRNLYKIALRKIYMVCKGHTKSRHGELYRIKSSIIERTAVNADQSLSYFPMPRNSSSLYFEPTHLDYHTLKVLDFENSLFKIENITALNSVEISCIYIQLEILVDQTKTGLFN